VQACSTRAGIGCGTAGWAPGGGETLPETASWSKTSGATAHPGLSKRLKPKVGKRPSSLSGEHLRRER
jgi:hypothetical protein